MPASVQVNYEAPETCSGVILEVPAQTVAAGDSVAIHLWAGTRVMLEPYALYEGLATLGAGVLAAVDATEITPIVDFAAGFEAQLDWPIDGITHVEAVTDIFEETDAGEIAAWAARGETVTDLFERKGYSCIRAVGAPTLYGSIRATCTRVSWRRTWTWTVPADEEGLHWFFLYKDGELDRKFSIELPDLTEAAAEDRTVTIEVINANTEAAVSGANVYVDDLLVGMTDANGQVTFDTQTGDHTLKITATGYLDSDADDIDNDTFTVE